MMAQKSSGKNGEEFQMDEPELLRLLMMHMSKNYHEDELQKFGDAAF